MGFNLGDILVTVKSKAEGFKKTADDVRGLEKGAGESGEKVKGFGEKLRGFATKVGIGMAVAGAALTVFAKKATTATADFTKGSIKLAREIGVSVKEASRLQFAARRMGLSIDQASTAFGMLSKQILRTNQATDASKTALGRLNIATKNANGTTRDFMAVLFDVADRFEKMPNGVEKTAYAMQLFGRSGKDLLPLLNEGSKGIVELMKRADELGITLSEKNVKQFREYVKAEKDLKDSNLALQMAIGRETIPVIAKFKEELNKVLSAALKLPEPLRSVAVTAAAFGGPVLSAAGSLIALAANLSEVMPHLSRFNKFGKAGKITLSVSLIGAEVVTSIIAIRKEWNQLKKDNESYEKSAERSKDMTDQLNQKIAEMPAGKARDDLIAIRDAHVQNTTAIDQENERYEGFKGILYGIGDTVNNLIDTIFPAWNNFWGEVGFKVGNAVNAVVSWVSQLPGRVGGWVSNMVGVVGSWFSNMANKAASWAGNLVNRVINWFSQLPGRAASWVSNMASRIASWFSNAANRAASSASNLVNRAVSFFRNLPGRAASAISGLGGRLAGVVSNAAAAVGRAAASVGRSIINGVVGVLPGPLRGAVKRALGLARGGLVQYLAGGGLTAFVPRGTDTVPAMLTPGEFVLNRDAVRRIGVDNLEAMNSGRAVQSARGGNVVHNHYRLEMSGIMARSREDIREIFEDGVRAIDERRRASGKSEILA